MIKTKAGSLIALALFAAATIVLAVAIGGVFVAPSKVLGVLAHNFFGAPLAADITQSEVAIILNLRMPRVALSFVTGAALATSGAIMQSILRNPLASSYTMGVSSGAALGVALLVVTPLGALAVSNFITPIVGLAFGLATFALAVFFAKLVDSSLDSTTIILSGMVFSLFANALLMLICSLARQDLARIIFWQLGSFSLKGWRSLYVLLPVAGLCIALATFFSKELDIMAFGDEQAKTMGVNTGFFKWAFLIIASLLTGSCVAFTGVIGFVDLIAPHVARRLLGPAHKYLIPASALFGGCLAVLADIVARTIIAPSELPVGVVTALIGAPFFAWIFFKKRADGGGANA